MVHQNPRKPVNAVPDWGRLTDTRIPAIDGGELEVWRVDPAGPSRGTVVLAHGWSRNRDRMVGRARVFGRLGFTTVLHSARDHGGSSPRRMMNAYRFGEDIVSVLDWVASPVILYGHSAASAGALLAASRRPRQVRLLFLEGSYADTRRALLSLYRSFNPVFGWVFGPAIIFWMDKFLYRGKFDAWDPQVLAGALDIPVQLVHGEKDEKFPVAYAESLQSAFRPGQAQLWVAAGAGHSDASTRPGYAAMVRDFVARHRHRLMDEGDRTSESGRHQEGDGKG